MSQPCNIAFYVHHHGSGHIMRTLAIAKALSNCKVTLLGSDLENYMHIIPSHYKVIHLPMDTPSSNDLYVGNNLPAGLHYAPLNIEGQRKRVNIMTHFFSTVFPLLLVVDVSVEIAMLATLSGVPFIVVKQHGDRIDLPHILAYSNAVGVLAPYPKTMSGNDIKWIMEKTFFAGGISRFKVREDAANPREKQVSIVVGQGGTSINIPLIEHIANCCPDWCLQVLGEVKNPNNTYENICYHGKVSHPDGIMEKCCIVIGNAGHNTVMEVAALGKRFITIPEDRPFNEQVVKARVMHELGLARIISPQDLYITSWRKIFENMVTVKPVWKGIISDKATTLAAEYLKSIYNTVFKTSSVL